MVREAVLDSEGRCARCVAFMHCAGRVRACRCDCTGAPADDAPIGPFMGARGIAGGTRSRVAFAWCDRCDGYHLSSARSRGARLHAGRVRLRWYGRIGAPTPFVDADTGRRVVGAIASDVDAPTLSQVEARAAHLHDDANASRDKHGATPSAWPCIAPARRDPDSDVTRATSDAFERLGRDLPSHYYDVERYALDRANDAREREAWRVAFAARLAARDAR